MTLPFRSILALSILVIVLAACGTTGGSPVSEAPSPTEPASPWSSRLRPSLAVGIARR